jgi:xanthine/uracil permease
MSIGGMVPFQKIGDPTPSIILKACILNASTILKKGDTVMMNVIRVIIHALVTGVCCVDVDGTLLDVRHDRIFGQKVQEEGLDTALEWYNNSYVANLGINWGLMLIVIGLRLMGVTLIMWTNRGDQQESMTRDNLGVLHHIFTVHCFFNGKKYGTNGDMPTLDNESKYTPYPVTSYTRR